MEKQKNIPTLCFPECSGEWEWKTLGEICEIKTGNKDTQNKIDDGLYPFFVRSNTIEKINTFSYDGEAILTSGDGVGVGKNFHYINGKFDFHQRVYSLRNFNLEYSGKFIYYIFSEQFYNRAIRLSAKNSVDSVRMDMIADMNVCFPTLPEQTKIATFLTAVDERLSQLKQKKTLLEQYKKGVMQKIFDQEIRFKDDAGKEFSDWEEKVLGDVTYKVDKKNKEKELLPVFSISNKNGFVPQSEQFDGVDSNDRGYDISLYKIIENNTFAYNPARINVGSIGYSGTLGRVIVSSLYVCFKTTTAVNDMFFNHYLNTYHFKNSVISKGEGGVRIYLFYENFSEITINLPCLPEQTKIANFLTAIDEKLNQLDLPVKLTSSRRFILTSVRRSKLTTYFQY